MKELTLPQYINLKERVEAFVKAENENAKLPTFRELAARYHVNQQTILDICDDSELLMYNIGVQIQGCGIGVNEHQGDNTVEYMGEDLVEA